MLFTSNNYYTTTVILLWVCFQIVLYSAIAVSNIKCEKIENSTEQSAGSYWTLTYLKYFKYTNIKLI